MTSWSICSRVMVAYAPRSYSSTQGCQALSQRHAVPEVLMDRGGQLTRGQRPGHGLRGQGDEGIAGALDHGLRAHRADAPQRGGVLQRAGGLIERHGTMIVLRSPRWRAHTARRATAGRAGRPPPTPTACHHAVRPGSLDRHATYAVAACLASASPLVTPGSAWPATPATRTGVFSWCPPVVTNPCTRTTLFCTAVPPSAQGNSGAQSGSICAEGRWPLEPAAIESRVRVHRIRRARRRGLTGSEASGRERKPASDYLGAVGEDIVGTVQDREGPS